MFPEILPRFNFLFCLIVAITLVCTTKNDVLKFFERSFQNTEPTVTLLVFEDIAI